MSAPRIILDNLPSLCGIVPKIVGFGGSLT